MNKNKAIRKILVFSAWLLVISGITTLLIAANRKQKEHVCREVFIGIKGNEGKFYVEKEDVLKQIDNTMNGSLLEKFIAKINLAKIENGLKSNPWIKNAELYFDRKDALHVFVEEREPVARVFTSEGNSFYMDSSGAKMPLLDKMSIRVPVVTGFMNNRKFNAADSALLQQTKQVVQFIYHHEFWNAQVGQIDITQKKKFELIPVVGDHIIKLGDGKNVEEKLNRLYVFYKQVMSKVGFNKYAVLDVEFKNQIVAIKKEPASPVDSLQMQKNIEELMNHANMQNIEKDMLPDENPAINKIDTTAKKTIPITIAPVPTKTNPNPPAVWKQSNQNAAKKIQTQSKPIEKSKQNVKKDQPVKTNMAKPKAVMPKQNSPL